MKNTEKEQLRQEILTKNIFMRQLRIWFLLSILIALSAGLIAFWGFTGFEDPLLPTVSASVRIVLAWIGTVIGTLSFLFSGLVVIGLINGRKHVLSLIDKINGR
jgi:hypothetical protein